MYRSLEFISQGTKNYLQADTRREYAVVANIKGRDGSKDLIWYCGINNWMSLREAKQKLSSANTYKYRVGTDLFVDQTDTPYFIIYRDISVKPAGILMDYQEEE